MFIVKQKETFFYQMNEQNGQRRISEARAKVGTKYEREIKEMNATFSHTLPLPMLQHPEKAEKPICFFSSYQQIQRI